MNVIRAGYDQLLRAPHKTITFTGASGLGLKDVAVPVYTVTGRVLLIYGTALVGDTLVSASDLGTISLGTASKPIFLVGASTVAAGAGAINDWWFNTGFSSGLAYEMVGGAAQGDFVPVACNENIIITPATQNITAGSLIFDFWYRPITDGASLT